jgi:excisionase family DNA binding protein
MDKLLKIGEVADLLSVTPSCIRKWVSLQFIPTVRLGRLVRFDRLAVEKWVKTKSDPGRLNRRVEIKM